MRTISIRKYVIILMAILVFSAVGAGIVWSLTEKQAVQLDIFDQISAFELEESITGEMYRSDNGKIKLLSFIFINCPDGVCPLTMQDFSELQSQLKEKNIFGTEVELLAITFDPVRDTTEALREYAGYFDADPTGWKFLRGTEEEIKQIADELSFFYALQEDGAGMHSTTMFLLDEQNQIRSYHKMSSTGESMDQQQILKNIYQLVKEKNQPKTGGNEIVRPEAPIEVTFKTNPETNIQAGDSVELMVEITQEGQAVEDAELVRFEIWYGEEEGMSHNQDGHSQMEQYETEHEMLVANNAGGGMYALSYTFEQTGTYNVMYHVDARGYHAMTKHEVLVSE